MPTAFLSKQNTICFVGFSPRINPIISSWLKQKHPISCKKQGVAKEVLPAFLSHASKLLPIDHFYSKIKKNNIPSQRLAEKIGGICIGTKSLLPASFPTEMADFAEKEFLDLFYLEYHFYRKKRIC